MNIKEARQSARLSQKEVARCLGISISTLNQWEMGTRSPKVGADEVIRKIRILDSLTAEGRDALAKGDLWWEEAETEYKIRTAKSLSKWGRYPDTFAACWNWIPESIFKVASPEALAELVDSIKECYDSAKTPSN